MFKFLLYNMHLYFFFIRNFNVFNSKKHSYSKGRPLSNFHSYNFKNKKPQKISKNKYDKNYKNTFFRFKPFLNVNYNFFFARSNISKKIQISNQNIFFFNFFDDLNFVIKYKKYYINYYFFKYKNNESHFLLRKNNKTPSFIIFDLRKNLIYKLKNMRKLLLNFFFFIKTNKQLSIFIKKYKNTLCSAFIKPLCLFLKDFICAINFAFSKKLYFFLLKKNIIFLNGISVNKYFCLLNTNDVIGFLINNAAYHYLLKNLFRFKLTCSKFSSLNVKNSYFFSTLINFEFFFSSFTFVFLNIKKKKFNFLPNHFYLNLNNIRTYNWLSSF